MPPRDSIANTFLVSFVLCVVCSLVVSGAAVSLKDIQQRNKLLDRQRNILEAAKLHESPKDLSGKEVEEIYSKQVEAKLVDLSTGEYISDADPTFDPRKAAKDPASSTEITSEFDIGLARRETKTWVYLVKDESGELSSVVLPVYGMGLWSTLYGYIALDSDLRTVNGLTYYEHAETPGLGGEVENQAWKDKWPGKKVWEEGTEAEDSNLKIGVVKGSPSGEQKKYMVDGLSGATITSRGVDSMLKYWFSDQGFGPFLERLAAEKSGGAEDGKANS